MGFFSKHKKAIIAASLTGTLFIGTLAGSMAYMSSLWETIYYGLTGTEVVHSSDLDVPEQNLYTGPYYDALHEAICKLDMSKIPDNADLGLSNTDFTIPGWNLKSYLQAYKLFAEICVREEINPPGEVQITPADLFGMMINESGGQCYSNFDSYLVWEGASDDTYWGPFEQNKIWSQIGRDEQGEGALAIYISWEENPDLTNDQRAYWGEPGAIKNGEGVLVNATTMEQLSGQGGTAFRNNRVQASTIEGLMKVGKISAGNQYKESRPNSKFFPDAAYGAALNLRFNLYGYNRYTLYKADYGSGHAIDKFGNLCSKNGMSGNFENASKALAIMLNGGQWNYTLIQQTVEASGGEVRAYQVMADSPNINFVGITTKSEAERKAMLGMPGHTDWTLLWGATPPGAGGQTSFTYPQNGLLKDYGIAESVAADMRLYTNNWEVWQTYFYGYRAINNGYEMNRIVRKACEYAASHTEWQYANPPSPPGGDDGGGGSTPDPGTTDPLPAGPADKTCTEGHGYCAKALSGKTTDNTSGFVLASDSIPDCTSLQSLWTGQKPIAMAGTTYPGHNGIDYPAGAGTALGAVQEGYIISIGAYPYNTFVGLSVSAAGSPATRWPGNFITIAHNDGYTTYAHLSSFAHIRVGQYVSKGQTIGYVGNTGNSAGNHLHVSWGKTKYLGVAGWLPGQYQFPTYGW